MKKVFNTKLKRELKKVYSKNELLLLRKYPYLVVNNPSYEILNRAYKRYIKNIDDYVLLNGYPSHWFSKSRRTFCNAVKTYIEAKKAGYTYDNGTNGYIWIEIVKVSGFNKYLDEIFDCFTE